MTDIPEQTYRVMETAIDLLDWVPPFNIEIYVANYVPLYHREEVRTIEINPDLLLRPLSIMERKRVIKPGRWVKFPDGARTFFKYRIY